MMTDYDFMLNEDQIELRNLVREFAEKEVRPTCRIAEKDAIVPEDLVKTAYGSSSGHRSRGVRRTGTG